MPAEARQHLDELFAPSNEAVAHMLAERGYADLPPWLRRSASSAEPA
jgi:hypothetical protein